MAYTVSMDNMIDNPKIVVVGCGGTGSEVAEGLCRLLVGSNAPLILIDYDRVKPHNLLRQRFFESDVGKFKSQALAERLARQYGRPIQYSVYPYDTELIDTQIGSLMHTRISQGIIIGCVDTPQARRSIAHDFGYGNWWLDAGNGYSSGQVLFGNANGPDQMQGAFEERLKLVDRLPLPSVQQPSLLAPPTVEKTAPGDCAEAVAVEEQSPVINHAMAMLVLQFMYLILNKQLTWMGAYIDLNAGTLQAVPAEPVTVARMLGIKVDTLMEVGCSIGRRFSLRRR